MTTQTNPHQCNNCTNKGQSCKSGQCSCKSDNHSCCSKQGTNISDIPQIIENEKPTPVVLSAEEISVINSILGDIDNPNATGKEDATDEEIAKINEILFKNQ